MLVGIVAGNDSQRGFSVAQVDRLMGYAGWDVDKIAFLIDGGLLQVFPESGFRLFLSKGKSLFQNLYGNALSVSRQVGSPPGSWIILSHLRSLVKCQRNKAGFVLL